MFKRIFQIVSYIVLLLAASLILYISFLLLYPFQVLANRYEYLPVVTKVVSPGQTLVYKSSFCATQDLDVHYTPKFVDDITVTLPSFGGTIKKGCYNIESHSFKIPNDLGPGNYKLVIDAEFNVNALQTQTMTFTSENFIVKCSPNCKN